MRVALVVLSLYVCCVGCSHDRLIVTEVISSDTVVLNDGRRVRYAGVRPAQGGDWSERSRLGNAYLVENKEVKLVVEPELSGKEETLAYVYTPVLEQGRQRFLFVNAELVRFGLVEALPVPPGCKRTELWESLWQLQQQEARPAGRNIWSQQKEAGH